MVSYKCINILKLKKLRNRTQYNILYKTSNRLTPENFGHVGSRTPDLPFRKQAV